MLLCFPVPNKAILLKIFKSILIITEESKECYGQSCWNAFVISHWTLNFHELLIVCHNMPRNCFTVKLFSLKSLRASLVVQWLRIRLPMQVTWVRALVREDPTCRGATKPVRHNYWAHVPQLLKPARLEPVLHNKRSHRYEKPVHGNEE